MESAALIAAYIAALAALAQAMLGALTLKKTRDRYGCSV
jgi:hypothetical protein